MHTFEFFFILSHTLLLHDSHLNTRFLNAELQANLSHTKANKMIEQIQPYNYSPNECQINNKSHDFYLHQL